MLEHVIVMLWVIATGMFCTSCLYAIHGRPPGFRASAYAGTCYGAAVGAHMAASLLGSWAAPIEIATVLIAIAASAVMLFSFRAQREIWLDAKLSTIKRVLNSGNA